MSKLEASLPNSVDPDQTAPVEERFFLPNRPSLLRELYRNKISDSQT